MAAKVDYTLPPTCPEHTCVCRVLFTRTAEGYRRYYCPMEGCQYRVSKEMRQGPARLQETDQKG